MSRLGFGAVCKKHFAKDEIIEYYENKIPDGSIQKIERGPYTLIKNPVPSIFLNLPKYLSNNKSSGK